MKRILAACLCFIAVCATLTAQETSVLKFNNEGKFKIVQFTDLHYVYGNEKSAAVTENMNAVLDAEHPDFVIITGDLVYGPGVAKALPEIIKPITSRKLPFAVVFGNHDDEFDLKRTEIYDILQGYPGSLMPARTGDIVPDYDIAIASADDKRAASVLYCFDSNAYTPIKGLGTYGWIKFDQIYNYRKESTKYTTSNGGAPLPALAFFHIPLPEYNYALSDPKTQVIGNKDEKPCSPIANSGLFTSMKEMGDVFGIFVGHDHDDDFVLEYYDMLLSYGRFSGCDTVYNHLKPNGARVIELTQDARTLETWLRLADGSTINKVSFPADFKKEEK